MLTNTIAKIEAVFGTIDTTLTQTRGKIHDYLGMTIDFSSPGTVKFTVIDYI
jgi:hypothetical protein